MVGNFCGDQIFVDFMLSTKITEFSYITKWLESSYTTKIKTHKMVWAPKPRKIRPTKITNRAAFNLLVWASSNYFSVTS